MTLRALACLTILAAITGCRNPSAPLSRAERAELSAAERRWDARGATEYVFEARVLCFCIPDLTIWNRIRVVGDSVVEVTPLEPVPGGGGGLVLQALPTVRSLFAVVRGATGDTYTDVRASYDPVLGYPRSIELTCRRGITDCGTTWDARNLVVIR